MIKKHFFGQGGAFAQRQQFKHLILFARQMNGLALDLNGFGIQINRDLSGPDDGLRMAFRAPHYGMDTRHQFLSLKRLGQIIIGAKPKSADFVFRIIRSGQN